MRLVRDRYRDLIRPHLPRVVEEYNGVQVRAKHMFDDCLPFTFGPPNPEVYEDGIVSSLRRQVIKGDSVVIVGGGNGVSAVIAARRSGSDGSVYVYEGSEDQIDRVKETAALNDATNSVTVKHAIVGNAVQLRGDAGQADTIPPTDLPNCDVLELDCEGVELEILQNMSFQPRSIIVETHGFLDSPTEEVEKVLEQMSYEIVNVSIADPCQEEICSRRDIRVLEAIKE